MQSNVFGELETDPSISREFMTDTTDAERTRTAQRLLTNFYCPQPPVGEFVSGSLALEATGGSRERVIEHCKVLLSRRYF